MARNEVRTAVDLLRHFAWSRREAVALSAGRRPNTDRNILSEVRLANLSLGRGAALPSAEDPYLFLNETRTFDLGTVLPPETLPRLLNELGDRFVQRDERLAARRVIERLRTVDPARADSLEARLARRTSRSPAPKTSGVRGRSGIR